MAEEEGPCERCPLYTEDGEAKDGGVGRLCASLIEYPIWIEDGGISIQVDNSTRFAEGCSEWTRSYFAGPGQRPGVRLHPRALLRIRTKKSAPKPRALCPHSWPAPDWARLIVEQIVMDTSGMQVRYLYNSRPWLAQPGIYTDCFVVVQNARSIFREWEKSKPKSGDNESSATSSQYPSNRSRAR